MIKILIVDDEPDVELLMKQRFRRQLKENEFTLFFAHNGIEALNLLSKDADIRMVISDINMPEMDGLTLLDNIQKEYPDVMAIIVSAYGDMNNIRTAMNRGAFDFVTKPTAACVSSAVIHPLAFRLSVDAHSTSRNSTAPNGS